MISNQPKILKEVTKIITLSNFEKFEWTNFYGSELKKEEFIFSVKIIEFNLFEKIPKDCFLFRMLSSCEKSFPVMQASILFSRIIFEAF